MIGYCKGRVHFCLLKVNVDLYANQDILVIALAGPFNVEQLVVLKRGLEFGGGTGFDCDPNR